MAEMELIYRDLGRRLKILRKAAQLTQETMAERVGLSRTSITNIEKGRQHIPLHTLYSIADVLGVSPLDLLPSKEALTTSNIIGQHLLKKALLGEEGEKWVNRIVASGKEG